MPACSANHDGWVGVSNAHRSDVSKNLLVTDDNRLNRLSSVLKNPAHESPQIVLCVGNQDNHEFAKCLLPRSDRMREYSGPSRSASPSSGASSAPSSVNSSPPPPPQGGPSSIFAYDSRPQLPGPVFLASYRTNSTVTGRRVSGVDDAVLGRLMFPFSDLIYIFAADLGGPDEVLDRIEALSTAKRATALPWKTLPRVCIVTSGHHTPESQLQQDALRARLGAIKYHRQFSVVRILPLDQGGPSGCQEYLRQTTVTELQEIRGLKESAKVQFSAKRLAYLFSQAVIHFARTTGEPFNHLISSRAHRPVPTGYNEQISALLNFARERDIHSSIVEDLVSSCLLMDAYPRSCHVFDPYALFDEFYAPSVDSAILSGAVGATLPGESHLHPACVAMIRKKIFLNFEEWTENRDGDEDWALKRHLKTLKRIGSIPESKKLSSVEFCLFCLASRPQHTLKCGHTMCEDCLRRFAHPQAGRESCLLLTTCMMCQTRCQLRVQLKPLTAGVRILSIDGGGVRGVVPLQFLCLLNSVLGSTDRLQDFFDLAFGTSAGGLIILGMFARNWRVSECMDYFCDFAKRIFTPQMEHSTSFPTLLRAMMRCLTHGGLYSSVPAEASFQQCFGTASSLFGHSKSETSRTKYAVTATRIDETAATVFPNYNLHSLDDVDSREKRAATEDASRERDILALTPYRRVERSDLLLEPRLSQVYLEAVPVGECGIYQDGGLSNPNPTDIALVESKALWDAQFDLVLSLGTGLSPKVDVASRRSETSSNVLSRLVRWSRARLFDAIDSEEVDRRVSKMLGKVDYPIYERWNPRFPSDLPRLDDIKSMDRLCEMVGDSPPEASLMKVKKILVASSFFFELKSLPKYIRSRSSYLCEGTIRIRGDPNLVLELLESFNCGPAQFVMNGKRLNNATRSRSGVCRKCRRFSQTVKFHVEDMDSSETVSLDFGQGGQHRISGFPQDMAWFCDLQGLHDVFSERPRPRSSCECELSPTSRESRTPSVDKVVVGPNLKRPRSQHSHELPMGEPLRKRRRTVERGSNFF
ncbi:hypothetical protein Q7P37_009843 [Cladosporium fusiforme]